MPDFEPGVARRLISFIVPAYNEEALIVRSLDSIVTAAQACGEAFELIVVDDDSSDGTKRLAEASGAHVLGVSNRQIARTRNAGARIATGDIFIFVDADTVIDAVLLRATLRALRAGAVGGGASLRLEGRIPWLGHILLWLVRSGMRLGRLAAGCYLFCTREAFEAVGGFDERLFASEEIALSRALARRGRVVILRERVLSSGRKLRTHTPAEIGRMMMAVIASRSRALRSRDDLDLWYGDRRRDVDQSPKTPGDTARP